MAIKTDIGTYPENPKVLQLPPAGGKYIDDLSGIEVMRFTDERDGNGTTGGFKNTYSVWPTFNRDNTRVWLFEYGGSYYVGNLNPTTFERVGPLEAVTPARGAFVDYESAFWAFSHHDYSFLGVDTQIWAYRPSIKSYDVVSDLRSKFPAGARFNQLYVSKDDDRFAAVVRSGSSGSSDYGVMVYERSTDSVKLNVSFDDINGITMDKSGRFVLLVRNDPEGQVKQRVFNVDTGKEDVLLSDANGAPDYCIGHNDCGEDFIVGGDQWRGAFTARKLSTPHDVKIAWQYATTGWINWHNSLRGDNESWALVSTYGGTLTRAGTLQEGPFVREIFQVGVKEPFIGQFRRLVHARANWDQPVRNYWATPRATLSRDGRFLCWTGNNNGSSDTSRTEVFVARIEPAPTAGTVPLPTEPSPLPPVPSPTPPAPPEPTPTPGVASPDGTKARAIIDSQGAKWTIAGADLTKPGETLRNGVNAGGGAGFIYKYASSIVYLLGTDNRTWYKWSGSNWQEMGTQEPGGTVITPTEPPIPPVEPPTPQQPKPCSITAPASLNIPRNGSGDIEVRLGNLTQPTPVSVIDGSDGQVTVSPLSQIASPANPTVIFKVRTKNKKQTRTITIQSPCGTAVVKVNVT